VGWLTVVAYAAAAVLCAREALRDRHTKARCAFWTALSVIMLLLGINKQLDLQTWFTLMGRRLARAEGWYERRRLVQFAFIFVFTCGSLLGFGAMWRLVQDYGTDLWLPLLGLFFIVSFVVIRAASFHHIDELLHFRLAGFKMNWLLELGGIGIIIAGALSPGYRRSETDTGEARENS
jgi:hypothetical protein